MKRLISIVSVIIIAASLIVMPAHAMSDEYVVQDKYNVGVFDLANVLDETFKSELLELGQECAKEMKLDVVFLTSDDTGGKGPTPYCDDFHDMIVSTMGFNRDQVILYLHLDKSWDGYEYDHINCYERAIDKISEAEAEKVLDAAFAVNKYNYYGRLSALCVNATKYYKLPNAADGLLLGFFPISYEALIIGAIISLVIGITLASKHNAANKRTSAVHYITKGDISVTDRDTRFIRDYTTVSRGYYKSSSSGSGRSGGSHRTSGGSRSRGSSRRR